MGELHVSNESAFSMISLNPPGSEGSLYSNNVTYVGGRPLGEGSVNHDEVLYLLLGHVDTIESSQDNTEDVKALLAGLNVGILLTYKNMSPEQQLQLQVDNVDPSNPGAPIILKYVKIADDALQSGDLAGVSVQIVAKTDATNPAGKVKSEERTDAEISAQSAITSQETSLSKTGTTDSTKPAEVTSAANLPDSTSQAEGSGDIQKSVHLHATNPWLAGTAYTQFVVSYFEILKLLKQMKEIDSKLELQGLAQVFELAKQTAETIQAAAKERAMMHIVQAVISGVSMVVTIGMTVKSVMQTAKFKVEEQGDLNTGKGAFDKDGNPMSAQDAAHHNRKLTSGAFGTSTIQMGYLPAFKSGTDAMNNVVQAVFELEAAKYDALKELLQAYRSIAQHQLDRASEGFKSETDMITQLLQQLDQMRQKLMEAISANMRKS